MENGSLTVKDMSLLEKFKKGDGICVIYGERKDIKGEPRQICLPFTYEDFCKEMTLRKFNPLLSFVSTYIKIAFVNDCLNYNCEIPRIERFLFLYKAKFHHVWREWFILQSEF